MDRWYESRTERTCSISSVVCEALTCILTLAAPFGTTGYETATTKTWCINRCWANAVAAAASLVPVKTVRAREPGARRGDVRFVNLDHFLIFRDVGLRGREPDGHEDSAWCGRHGERNALFAELVVPTGLRLEEAASLLATEMPTPDSTPARLRSLSFRLPAAIAKAGSAPAGAPGSHRGL